jgi:hypothetical protein
MQHPVALVYFVCLVNIVYSGSVLSSCRVTQFYRITNLHTPENPVTAVVLRTAIKETRCSMRTQDSSEMGGNISDALSTDPASLDA